MPTHHPSIDKAPEPTRVFFDPFNSSSTGHQRADNRLSGSTSWRDSRSHKLAHQFRDISGRGGGQHLADLVGAGRKHPGTDGRKENGSWEPDAPGLREDGCQDIRSMMGASKKRKIDIVETDRGGRKKSKISVEPSQSASTKNTPEKSNHERSPTQPLAPLLKDGDNSLDQPRQIFRGLTMYINGSTMPLVSDHRLKQLIVQHGGNSSISLGRRTVTHVILGEQGRGGGLASTKIQKENSTVRGKGIKYVSAKWVLDSVQKEIRQPEVRYTVADVRTRLGGSGQASVASIFKKAA